MAIHERIVRGSCLYCELRSLRYALDMDGNLFRNIVQFFCLYWTFVLRIFYAMKSSAMGVIGGCSYRTGILGDR